VENKDVIEWNDIHNRMTRNVWLNTELLINNDIFDICEYDIQAFMFNFFKSRFVNSGYNVKREREGKFDCVVYKNNLPFCFYEIKTYFKETEKLNEDHFKSDITKLANKLLENDNAKGYMFTSGMKSKFNEILIDRYQFINNHLDNETKSWQKFEIDSGKEIQLRPSRKQHTCCLQHQDLSPMQKHPWLNCSSNSTTNTTRTN